MHAPQRRVCSLIPRISYNDILASFTCENYRCIPWFRGSCRRGKGIPETDAGHDIPAGLSTRKESNCTGSCDAEILARAQMFVQVENRTYFRYYRHKRNARRPCAISRHSPETEAGEPAMAGRPEPSFSRICKRPHRLRNGDAALAAAGGPRCCQTTSRTPLAGKRTEFQTAQATSIQPRSRRQAWGPRCPDRWAAYSRR